MAQDKYITVNSKRYEITFYKNLYSVWIDGGFWGGPNQVGKASSLEDAIRLAKVHQGDSSQKLEIYDRI